jgi:hypothetical protein
MCTLENTFTGCAPCIIPGNAIALSVGTPSKNNSCVWECPYETVYNTTLQSCQPIPLVVAATIDPQVPVAQCSRTDCGWGNYIHVAINLVSSEPIIDHLSAGVTCIDLCVPCIDALPARAVYTRKSSCEWVCTHPNFLYKGVCTQVPVT